MSPKTELRLGFIALNDCAPLVVARAMREVDPEGMAEKPRTARPLSGLIAARNGRGEPLPTFAQPEAYAASVEVTRTAPHKI